MIIHSWVHLVSGKIVKAKYTLRRYGHATADDTAKWTGMYLTNLLRAIASDCWRTMWYDNNVE